MYYKILLVLLVFSVQGSFGQKSKLKQAHKLFNQRAYIKAAELFEQLPQSYQTLTKQGDCFYYNGLMEKAAALYLKAADKYPDSMSIANQFKLAQSLYGIEKITLADSVMALVKNTAINTLNYRENLTAGVPYLYNLTILKTGSFPGDFGANFYGNEITFASSRAKAKKTYSWNQKPYLNIYKGKVDEASNLFDIHELSNTINTQQHESNAVISADGNTLYFSRSNKKRYDINGQKVATVGIYKAKLVNNQWTEAEILPFCSNSYSTQHPALDEVNNRLYFASDMPGGYGSFDIYYVNITETGFSEPVNLGALINTPYRDNFPFISKDGVLYFSSEGHLVLGGLDIFFCETLDNGDWSTPLNLGPSINTGLDDFAFIVDSDTNKGYISSNRNGSDYIYAFTRETNDRKIIVEGFVRDKNSKQLLPGTVVTLFNDMHQPVDSVKVGNDGFYTFRAKPKSTYFIEGFKPLYIPSEQVFNTDDTGKIELNIELEIESYDDAEEIVVKREDGYVYIELENIYFDLDKWEIKPQAANTLNVLVDLMLKYPRMEVELGAHTDNRSGEAYNLKLSKNRAQAAYNYIVSKGINKSRLKAIGYGESRLLVNCGDECTEDEHAINRRCEFIITK